MALGVGAKNVATYSNVVGALADDASGSERKYRFVKKCINGRHVRFASGDVLERERGNPWNGCKMIIDSSGVNFGY